MNPTTYQGVSLGAIKADAGNNPCLRCGRNRDYRKDRVCRDCRTIDPWFASIQDAP